MLTEELFLIEILKAFIHKDKLQTLPNLSLKNLFDLSVKHNVAGIVYDMIAPLMEDQKNSAIYQQFQQQNIVTVYNSAIRESEMSAFSEKLEQAHIPYVFFKGAEIKKLYPQPDLRTMGDVDVLVHEESMKAVKDILESLGYEKSDGGSTVWTFHNGFLSYEIHSRLVTGNYWNDIDYEAYFEKIFDKLIPAEKGCRKYFSVEDHFIFLCFHLAKHLDSSGAGIRMFMDIALYLMCCQREMDWDYIWRECKNIKLDEFVQIAASACKEWFEIDLNMKTKAAEKETLDQLRGYVMSGGIFGFERDESFRRLRKGMKSKKNENSLLIKIRALIKIIFPDRKHMACFLPKVSRYPFLLPVAWCKRWKIGFDNRWKMKAAVSGMDKNMEEAKAQYSLLKRIGL